MPDVEIELRNKQKLLFTLTEEKLSEFLKPDGTPDSKKLLAFAQEKAPQVFADLRSYDSANRYRQGGSKPAPKVEPKQATPQPKTLPAPWTLSSARMEAPAKPFTQEQVDAYRARWFKSGTGGAGGSIPYQVLSDYLMAPDRKAFRFPIGFSSVGQAAVKAEAEARVAAQRESEKRAIAESERLRSSGTEAGEKAAAGAMFMGKILPTASRRMTAARTGQQASEALPLGLLPEYQLSGSGGARGTAERFLGMTATPEAMLMAAGGAMAAPVLAAEPALGAVAALAGLIPAGQSMVKAVQSGKSADYGEALANLILFGAPAAGPISAFGLRGLQSAKAATAARMAAREAQIGAMQPSVLSPMRSIPTQPSYSVQPAPRPQGFLPTQAQVAGVEAIPGSGGRPLRTSAEVAAELPIITGPEKIPSGGAQVAETTSAMNRSQAQSRLDDLYATRESLRNIGLVASPQMESEIASLEGMLGRQTGQVIIKPEQVVIGTGRRKPGVQPVPEPEKRPASIGMEEMVAARLTRSDIEGQLAEISAEKQRLFNQGKKVPFAVLEREAKLRNALRNMPEKKSDVVTSAAVQVGSEQTTQPSVAPEVPVSTAQPTASVRSEPIPTPVTPTAAATPPAVPPSAPVVPTAPEPAPQPIVRGIMQALQNAEKERLGVTGETPRQGSVSRIIEDDVRSVVQDTERRAAFLEEINNTNFDHAAQVNRLDTRHQAAAYLRQEELKPLLDSPDPAVRRAANAEWFKMYQAIYKIGSKKGFELALQKLFNRVIDFGSADAPAKARGFILDTMRNAGATDEVAAAAVEKIMPTIQNGITETTAVRSRESTAASLAEETMAAARASGRSITDESVMRDYRARLQALGKTQLPSWAGQKSVLLAPVVREYRNGVRSLEAMKTLIKTKYGAVLSDAEINDLMARAGIEFEKDNSRIKDILRQTHKMASREAWNSYSTSRKGLETLKRFQNFDRLITLGLDLGIFGTQFGLAAATRPSMAFAKLPSTARRGRAERVAAMTIGGIPSPKEMISKERGGGMVASFVKSLASEAGQAAAEQDIATLGRMRYPEFDDPFAEAGLMGFQTGDAPGAGLARELSFAAEESIRGLPKGVRELYTASQRATETGLRYGRALLFDQMMAPFENLPRDDKLGAMRAVASFVNTLTGGPAYESKFLESAIGLVGHLQTAPRYYMSNIEMATGTPLARTMLIGKAQGLNGKEVAKLGKMVATEYGRLFATLTAMQGALRLPTVQEALRKQGVDQVEIVTDPFDKDFGTMRYRVNQNTERTVSILGGRERYVPLILQTVSGVRTKRMAYGAPTKMEAMSAGQRGSNVLQTMYGKSTFFPRTAASLIPYSYPQESQYTGFNPLDAEFRAPGGAAFVPSKAAENIPMMLSYLGQRIPMPLLVKEIVNFLPQAVRQGTTEEGKKAIMKAQLAGMVESTFGRLSRISPTPEIRNFVLNKQAIRKLPPDVRKKLEMDIMTEGPVQAINKTNLPQSDKDKINSELIGIRR